MCDFCTPGEDRLCSFPACPSCGRALDLQQPDARRPELLLGVCGECMLWALVDGRDGGVIELIAARLTRGQAPPAIAGRRRPAARIDESPVPAGIASPPIERPHSLDGGPAVPAKASGGRRARASLR